MRILKRLILLFLFAFSLPITGLGQANLYPELVMQGIDAMHEDSLELAEKKFREALSLTPDNKSNYLLFRYLGQIREQQDKDSEALDFYTAALNLSPRNTDVMLDRAALYYRMGNESRALLDYTDVLDLQPTCGLTSIQDSTTIRMRGAIMR